LAGGWLSLQNPVGRRLVSELYCCRVGVIRGSRRAPFGGADTIPL